MNFAGVAGSAAHAAGSADIASGVVEDRSAFGGTVVPRTSEGGSAPSVLGPCGVNIVRSS